MSSDVSRFPYSNDDTVILELKELGLNMNASIEPVTPI